MHHGTGVYIIESVPVLLFPREVEPARQRDGRLQRVPPHCPVGQPQDAIRPPQEQPVLRSGCPGGGEGWGHAQGSSLAPVWGGIVPNGVSRPLALRSPAPSLRPPSAMCYFLVKPRYFFLLSFLSFGWVSSDTAWCGPRSDRSRTLVCRPGLTSTSVMHRERTSLFGGRPRPHTVPLWAEIWLRLRHLSQSSPSGLECSWRPRPQPSGHAHRVLSGLSLLFCLSVWTPSGFLSLCGAQGGPGSVTTSSVKMVWIAQGSLPLHMNFGVCGCNCAKLTNKQTEKQLL